MPIYEYRCQKCQKEFEVLVKSFDEKVQCEHCGSRRVEKKFSVFGTLTSDKPHSQRPQPPCGPHCQCSPP